MFYWKGFLHWLCQVWVTLHHKGEQLTVRTVLGRIVAVTHARFLAHLGTAALLSPRVLPKSSTPFEEKLFGHRAQKVSSASSRSSSLELNFVFPCSRWAEVLKSPPMKKHAFVRGCGFLRSACQCVCTRLPLGKKGSAVG